MLVSAKRPILTKSLDFWFNADNDLLGQHAIFAEHTAVSSATHPCPYIAYFGPIHPSSSNSSGSVSDGSNFNNHWNGPSVPSEIPTSYAFPTMHFHYHSWEHNSPPFSTNSSRIGADQPSIPPVTQRPARANSDIPRSGSFMHPFLVGHRWSLINMWSSFWVILVLRISCFKCEVYHDAFWYGIFIQHFIAPQNKLEYIHIYFFLKNKENN